MTDETFTITPAERRLTGQLIFTGVMLGAMFIAVVALVITLYVIAFSKTGPLENTRAELAQLKTDYKTTSADLVKTKSDLKDANARIAELMKPPPKPGGKPALKNCPVDIYPGGKC